ncbi:unnamed protein product, partial [Timema podura]|nr:unnamed protein product [Timema podura]
TGKAQRLPSDRRRSLVEFSHINKSKPATRYRQLSLVELSASTDLTCGMRLAPSEQSSTEIDTSSLSIDTGYQSPPCRCKPSDLPHYSGCYEPFPSDLIKNTRAMDSPIFRPVWRAIILGQVMSVLLCIMATCSHYLNNKYLVVLPTGQNFLHYALLCIIYTTWLACRNGERGLVSVLRLRGWRYMLVALVDVEANYLLGMAYKFTTLTSIQLLDCVSIPTVLALSCILLKVRYKIVHIVGISLCLMGVGCLVWADIEDGKPISGGKNRLLGDMLCLGGSAMFAALMVAEEFVVKTLDWVEYLGMLGLFGSLFCGLQL